MAKDSNKKASPKRTSKKSPTKRAPKKTTMDKLQDAVLSREMLAAGISASAATIAASPKARRALREAGRNVADTTSSAANLVMNSTAKFAALIGEAVAAAVEQALSGNLLTDDGSESKRNSTSKSTTTRGNVGPRSSRKRNADEPST